MNVDEARTAVSAELTRIAPELDLSAVAPDAPLREEADLDSLDFLTLVQRLHDSTGVEIPESDYPLVATLASLVDYVGHHSPSTPETASV